MRAPVRNTTALMVTMALTKKYWNICNSVGKEFGTMTRETVFIQLSPIKAPVVSQPAFIFESAEVAIMYGVVKKCTRLANTKMVNVLAKGVPLMAKRNPIPSTMPGTVLVIMAKESIVV